MASYIRRLLTGVAICDRCGATWELYRLRPKEAVCRCGAPLRLIEEAPRETNADGRAAGEVGQGERP